jgi:hypothetical protein
MSGDDDELAEVKRKIEFVAGQVHLLIGFLVAVIDTHPDPDDLARRFEKIEQITLARTEGVLVAEDYIDGELDISKRLKRAIEIARGRKASRRTDQG